MDATAYYDLTRISGPALSPDGHRVAYLGTEADRREDETRQSLFVVPTDGSKEPHRLSRVSDAGRPQWSPDGRHLAFQATRDEDTELAVTDEEDTFETEEEDDSEEPSAQVWVFDMELGGDARQITQLEHGVEDFDWGPEGERLVVSATDPDEENETYLEQVEEDGPIEIERPSINGMDQAGQTKPPRTYSLSMYRVGRSPDLIEPTTAATMSHSNRHGVMNGLPTFPLLRRIRTTPP